MTRLDDIRAARTLDELYALVPDMEDCVGHCWESCGPIGMSSEESRRVDRALGMHVPNTPFGETPPDMCPALTPLHRCKVYSVRPMICRLWGPSAAMPCVFGCHTKGEQLSEEESELLFVRSIELGGDPRRRGGGGVVRNGTGRGSKD